MSKINNPITTMSALELSKAIKGKQVSCVEVMNAYLDKIDVLNPKVNAIVALQDRDDLVKQAKEKDQELAAGKYAGWMHGFPHAVKDLSAVKGIVMSNGSPLFKNFVPEADSVMVSRIRKAGAIMIGKTNTPEFGLGSNTKNPVYGTTFNAYDQSKTSGGSSGGAAVALALQMVPSADGSDMMGSLRNPAAFNNVIGFRPTQGRVPFGPGPEVWFSQLGYEGPMGRNIADTAELLKTQSGFDSRVPLSLGDPLAEFGVPPKKLRIGWLKDMDGGLDFEKGIIPLCEKALKVFTDMGHIVEEVKLDVTQEFIWSTWLTQRHWTVSNGLRVFYNDAEKRKLLKPEAIWEIEGGLNLTGQDVFQAGVRRTTIYQAFNKLFASYDILVLPTAQMFPFDPTNHSPMELNGKKLDTYHRYMEVVTPGTLSGCPVLNVPVGFNEKGLPMGMQLIGPYAKDMELLNIGYVYEQATRWNLDHKPALLKD
ncbi:amidase [Zophobihabitans entericus]|uniref:Amidase n=1 Tax=Zophobihabitans entericus TaxID=1635327 RepID=A0A6G9I9X0_9GAMM|nr:amidase [Zophobihabitans entericus]QIQ20524.1 amidase [Zophobihabitans entericus]